MQTPVEIGPSNASPGPYRRKSTYILMYVFMYVENENERFHRRNDYPRLPDTALNTKKKCFLQSVANNQFSMVIALSRMLGVLLTSYLASLLFTQF